ncbi:hypothetical protein H6S82_16525 [Planktothrix sp. FACHB-1355]|uniref:Phasin family protein n=1 Tax=Aerosakkonema funiforme FACHB-1375 TaxID=2949571 RepID=A0A926VEB9_9CYAN|nr:MULTISPECIES: hypothetical protein [Oscillatoriales]MBD2182341.1 hypothetical protein [Aerosakkonema funiforme FACHB-1375]MBD3560446.1 hypothetical protein [Planktothrix sp. FACHB-1355]
MAGLGDLVKKAFYLGVGVVATAGERAGMTLAELREQAQKLADEMVAKGEMTTEDARRLVDEMVNRAQQQQPIDSSSTSSKPSEPRRIEIVVEDDDASGGEGQNVDVLRQQVMSLQDELRRLKQD